MSRRTIYLGAALTAAALGASAALAPLAHDAGGQPEQHSFFAGRSGPGTSSTDVSTGGQPFLPAYLAMLQGKRAWPPNRCYPQNLLDLLAPCDGK
ncbi:hypothetical protein MCNS_32170 [Mycobacterium conspicuum]|uniref:Uncharacterized protein n=1 Tax=Mycobacterium conspicuum TaxID=44010 RepID=A0A1X1TPX1_9MYCO|nr:hypothetical protein AWC00_02420 [Mycobacterium conspicuum]BBZ40154.1 hypothetical protein MCNS_32170 [Mycobacterium conspicuum]